jgi:hypothetical protein
MATKSLPSSQSIKLTVPRCQHGHIYKFCQLLRHSNSVLKFEVVVFENVGKTLLPCLTNGLESEVAPQNTCTKMGLVISFSILNHF